MGREERMSEHHVSDNVRRGQYPSFLILLSLLQNVGRGTSRVEPSLGNGASPMVARCR